jgi:hypothetical protein
LTCFLAWFFFADMVVSPLKRMVYVFGQDMSYLASGETSSEMCWFFQYYCRFLCGGREVGLTHRRGWHWPVSPGDTSPRVDPTRHGQTWAFRWPFPGLVPENTAVCRVRNTLGRLSGYLTADPTSARNGEWQLPTPRGSAATTKLAAPGGINPGALSLQPSM